MQPCDQATSTPAPPRRSRARTCARRFGLCCIPSPQIHTPLPRGSPHSPLNPGTPANYKTLVTHLQT